ncbi:MAG TPA: MlaD family protein [Gemmatimonadaceae bacterium]|jgi:ABC-type transporter Mla subunit MlaD|nr:MlaD family protein [Gemmatimonadaceae bacterium]
MSQQLHWRELTGGLIAMTVIVVLTLIVLVFARVGALHGKKVTLYVVTDGAPGVMAGTEVWLAGEKQGLVKDVTFRPPSADKSERLLITTEFLAEALPNVRRDSYAQIRPGGSLIGVPVINIAPGSATSPPLHAGDTVPTRKAALTTLTQDVGKIGPQFAALGAATRELSNKITRPVGTIGNYRANGLPDLPDVSAGISSLNARAHGNGTIGRAMRGDLRASASRTMASADSIRTLLASNRGSIGRFRRDTTLVGKAQHVLAQLDSLHTLLSTPLTGIAMAHSDSALTRKLAQTHALLAALIRDVKENPMRYIRF